MADSRRQLIVAALRTRLQAITIANGYNTDGGQEVFHGNGGHSLDDAVPRTVIAPGEIAWVRSPGKRLEGKLPIVVEATMMPASTTDPLATAELLLADLKKALFQADHTMGGLDLDLVPVTEEAVDRSDGGNLIAARVELEILYQEIYGDPYGDPA